MSPLLALSLVLASAAARVDSVQLSDTGARTAVRVGWTGTPALVSVHREGNVARVSLSDAELGMIFSGGSRFEWSSATAPAPASSAPFRGLRIESRGGEVFFHFDVSSEIPIDVQRGPDFMIVSFREGGPAGGALVASRETAPTRPAPPPAPPVIEARSAPAPAPSAPTGLVSEVTSIAPRVSVPESTTTAEAVAPTSRETETADLHRRLFPVPTAEPTAPEPEAVGAPASDLYTKLFPYAAEKAPAPATTTEAVGPAPEELAPGLRVGPLNFRPGIRVGYVDAKANFLSTPEPVRDHYLEVQPKLVADAGVGSGRLAFSYEPVLRAFGSFDVTRSFSHPVTLTLDSPLGTRAKLSLADEFLSGVLETTKVDPGGEYFFDLGRFNRNAATANASIDVGPRLSLELGGGFDFVHFTEASSFFDYRHASGTVGLGFEATPTLKAIFGYAYDAVPTPDGRPQAKYEAHSVQVSFLGDIVPLVRGSLTVGYRDQKSPNSTAVGTRFRGLTATGTLTKDFGHESAVTLLVNRSTPVSNFQGNPYYVSTSFAASFLAPLPYAISLNGGGVYHWNGYPTLVTGSDLKREDRIFGWFVGLRRPLDRRTSAFAGYRWERRRSNVDSFENDTNGLLIQLDVDVFGRSR